MKKIVAIILTLVVLLTTVTGGSANSQENGYVLEINGEQTEYTSVIFNDIHYVPMRKVFEILGANIDDLRAGDILRVENRITRKED